MLCKSASGWSLSASALALSLSVAGATAHAITVTPESPYEAHDGINIYYDTSTDQIDSGYKQLDVTATASTDSAGADMVKFTVNSNAVTETEQVIVIRLDLGQTGDSLVPIPIAYANGTCSTSNCQGTTVTKPDGTTGGVTGYFYSAIYTRGTDLVIGFYPSEVCASLNAMSLTQTEGCTTGSVSTITTSQVAKYRLRFTAMPLARTETNVVVPTTNDTSSVRIVNLTDSPPVYLCDLSDGLYYPADSSIILSPNRLAATGSNNNTAPLESIALIGEIDPACNGAVTPNDASPASNSINSRVSLAAGVTTVTGFINGSDINNGCYTLRFGARNRAGRLGFTDNSSSACLLDEVQTAPIGGFLNDSRCFIASAAFRSSSAPPVMLLRKFRDSVLRRLPAGERLIELYYAHSPVAARWLLKNPAVRVPVLAALTPILVAAWIVTTPMALLFAGAWLSVVVGWVIASRQTMIRPISKGSHP